MLITEEWKDDGVAETQDRDDDRRVQDVTGSGLVRTDGTVSYSNRSPRAQRRFAVPALVVTVGVLAGTAVALIIDLL